jgi:hypothetical protein
LTGALLLFTCASTFALSPAEPTADRAAVGQGVLGTRSEEQGQEHGRHGEFEKWDSHKRGYLTSEDVRGDEWLSKNFERCNEARDGHMRREEFARCHE